MSIVSWRELRRGRLRRVRELRRGRFREAHAGNLREWRLAQHPDELIAGQWRAWTGIFFDLGDDMPGSQLRGLAGPPDHF